MVSFKKMLIKYLPDLLCYSGINKIRIPGYAGHGAIISLHRVRPNPGRNTIPGANNSLEIRPDDFDALLCCLNKKKYTFISLDDLYAGLMENRLPRHFAVLTFDDGYLDNFEYAYPILKKYQVPFCIYITTSFPQGDGVPWWYLLEDLILEKSFLDFLWKGNKCTFSCASPNEKLSAFKAIQPLFLEKGCDVRLLLQTINGKKVDCSRYNSEFLDWNIIKQLADDALVTIGAHTVNHHSLAALEDTSLLKEVNDSRTLLEKKIYRKISHFAYPYGRKGEADKRVFDRVSELGFKTAVTTRAATISPACKNYLHQLPRILISGEREGRKSQFIDLWLNGTWPFDYPQGWRTVDQICQRQLESTGD